MYTYNIHIRHWNSVFHNWIPVFLSFHCTILTYVDNSNIFASVFLVNLMFSYSASICHILDLALTSYYYSTYYYTILYCGLVLCFFFCFARFTFHVYIFAADIHNVGRCSGDDYVEIDRRTLAPSIAILSQYSIEWSFFFFDSYSAMRAVLNLYSKASIGNDALFVHFFDMQSCDFFSP